MRSSEKIGPASSSVAGDGSAGTELWLRENPMQQANDSTRSAHSACELQDAVPITLSPNSAGVNANMAAVMVLVNALYRTWTHVWNRAASQGPLKRRSPVLLRDPPVTTVLSALTVSFSVLHTSPSHNHTHLLYISSYSISYSKINLPFNWFPLNTNLQDCFSIDCEYIQVTQLHLIGMHENTQMCGGALWC